MAIAEPNFLANGNDDDTKKKIKKANIKWVVKLFYFLYFTNFKTGRRYTNQKPEAKKSLISTIYMSLFFNSTKIWGKELKILKWAFIYFKVEITDTTAMQFISTITVGNIISCWFFTLDSETSYPNFPSWKP